ncbi:Uncharacterized protein PCOAH_00030090 [Plasmodium coatneyi]|uniref:Uncharacterized protein n=1 Tax=Plasmodium coatneyi TaxID=208452 RepID=A0A1B1E0F6_9APIC|nr:Uncharacterized protein PCOAH_00030090 [Plasmodium coatneyi]ANQ08513.1 Uncharacterized protein PCOAH_00030090 [Plasmodium coatneyi]
MNSLKKKKQDILWGKKWRNLIQQKAIKEEMNKQLKASLEKQKQEEEEKECTFKPQTLWNQSFKKTISFVDEFFVKLKPYIEQQQAYLNQLKELDRDDEIFAQKIKEELRSMLAKAVDKEIMESIIEGYKGVRTRGINKVKRERLDILSKMIKLERAYNCFMAKENVDKKDLGECGFDCDLAAKLRNDILKNSLCPNSLRDFARIRLEINQVLEEELHKRENEKDNLTYSTGGDNNELSRSEEDYTGRYTAFVNSSGETSQESLTNTSDNRVADDGAMLMGESCQVVTPTRNVPNGGSAFYQDGQMEEARIGSHEPQGATYEYSPPMEYINYTMNTVDTKQRNNKNVYLNSNYTAILKNEDAHKYVSSLQKDLSSVNVIIMNNNAAKSVISSGGATMQSGAYYGRDKPTYMDPNNINRPRNFDQVQQGRGSVPQVLTHKGEFPTPSSRDGRNAQHAGESPERKNTRYVDKNTYVIRNGNNFYDVDGMKNKKEEVFHQMNPFFRNELVNIPREDVVPVGVTGGTTTLGTSAHFGGNSPTQGVDPGKPLLRKIMDKFAIL